MALAPMVPVHTQVTPFPLERAADALEHLRSGRVDGAIALRIS
jgi:propanol-preferring alcohol dehydrogenase